MTDSTSLLHAQLLSRPGGRVGERPPRFIGFRSCRRLLRFKVSGAGLADLEARAPEPLFVAEGAESPLAGTGPHPYLSVPLWEFRPIPVSRNFGAWDCKVTPAGSSCQEGNTIGCIPSNDGLDAGFGPCFPHCGKQRVAVICRMRHFRTVCHGRGWGCRGFSFAPPGLADGSNGHPRLAPWAAFYRRFAADGSPRTNASGG